MDAESFLREMSDERFISDGAFLRFCECVQAFPVLGLCQRTKFEVPEPDSGGEYLTSS